MGRHTLKTDKIMSRKNKYQGDVPVCGNCALCIRTNRGGECQLSDTPVDYDKTGCVDYIAEE